MRTIILHYHLFKNAGTSVDHLLKESFGPNWLTQEFPAADNNNTALVEKWIADTPDAVAYSSHTMLGPLPRVPGVQVVPILLLRDPIARIRSAYRFERNQEADTWGAKLAKEHNFEGYVRARLERSGDRQCRNFQTSRLASLVPGEAPELDRAIRAVSLIHTQGILGIVHHFDNFLDTLKTRLSGLFQASPQNPVHANVSRKIPLEEHDALSKILRDSNRDDLKLMERAQVMLDGR